MFIKTHTNVCHMPSDNTGDTVKASTRTCAAKTTFWSHHKVQWWLVSSRRPFLDLLVKINSSQLSLSNSRVFPRRVSLQELLMWFKQKSLKNCFIEGKKHLASKVPYHWHFPKSNIAQDWERIKCPLLTVKMSAILYRQAAPPNPSLLMATVGHIQAALLYKIYIADKRRTPSKMLL